MFVLILLTLFLPLIKGFLLLLFLIGVFLFIFFLLLLLLLLLEFAEALLLIPEKMFILYLLNIDPFDKIGLLLTYRCLPFCMKLIALFCTDVLNKGLWVRSNFFLKTLKAL